MNLENRHRLVHGALVAIQRHQQGHHGWRILHEAIERLHTERHPALCRLLECCWRGRPLISDTHLITLLSIAVRQLALRIPAYSYVFESNVDVSRRCGILSRAIDRHEDELAVAISDHSNSFTGARRFLVPQIVLAGFARTRQVDDIKFLDLGTGLGVLPRQLNSPHVFERFAEDLEWRPVTPVYSHIPLSLRVGVDAHPLPTMEWVRSCHGPSEYYDDRYKELLWSIESTAGGTDEVHTEAMNILDLSRLVNFIKQHRFNVVNCGFVLYQYAHNVRQSLIGAIMSAMPTPGLFLSTEPNGDLLEKGCVVTAHIPGIDRPLHVADVSDSHFMGVVTAGSDFATIVGDLEGALA